MNYEWMSAVQNLFILAMPTVIFVLAIVMIVLMIGLILRPFQVWYWKIDKHGRELENLNSQLYQLRREVGLKGALRAFTEEENFPKIAVKPKQEASVSVCDEDTEKVVSGNSESHDFEKKHEEYGNFENEQKNGLRRYNTDKYGRIYTEEEIENQIKD